MKGKPIRRIGIVVKSHSPHARSVLGRLTRWLDRKGIPYHCGPGAAALLRTRARETRREEIYQLVDLLVVLGGDGTFLSVARDIAPHGVPILGVNLGSLGFLTEVTQAEMTNSMAEVFSGNYEIQRRMMLEARIIRRGRRIGTYHILNDVVLNKSALARIVEIDIAIDGKYVTSYRADGLIVSSPTGSTAYSLSAGGPILYPTMHSFCITPICPHTLTNRPLVIPAGMRIGISLKGGTEENVYLTMDGQVGVPMQRTDQVEIRRSRHSVKLIQLPGKPYFDVLRNKLKWGGR